MIFARDKSQMCNNLLQFAHVYAWGREHGRKVMSMRFSYKYPYFKITHSNLVSFPLYVIAKLLAAIKVIPTASFKHAECDPEELERMMMRHRHIVVSGWYVRYYELFLKYRHEICDLFTIDATYTEPVKEKMKPWQGTRLGVHIRRGDYAIWMNGIYCYEDSVYADFIQQFFILIHILIRQPQLVGGSPRLRYRSHGFKPDQSRTGLRKTMIAADGPFPRGPVLRPIGSLHGLKRDAVGCLFPGQR
jgi:hypothetical protein